MKTRASICRKKKPRTCLVSRRKWGGPCKGGRSEKRDLTQGEVATEKKHPLLFEAQGPKHKRTCGKKDIGARKVGAIPY